MFFFWSCKILFGLVKFITAPDRMSGNVCKVFVNTGIRACPGSGFCACITGLLFTRFWEVRPHSQCQKVFQTKNFQPRKWVSTFDKMWIHTSLYKKISTFLKEAITQPQRYSWPRNAVCNVSGYRCVSDCRSGVASSIPVRSHTFVKIDHEIISTVILLPSADLFKKGCCQLQAKVCARITG